MIPLKKERRAAVQGLKAAAASSGDAVRAGDFELAAKQFYAASQVDAVAFDSLPEPQRRIMRDNVRTVLLSAETPPPFNCEDAQRITARTLLIEGDATAHLEHMAAEGLMRCLPNRDRATIKGASRSVNRGQPEAFNEAVSHFIEAPTAPVQPPDEEP
jgi:pimeloyl-ACP methyl ester carboxylesterase